MSTPRILELAAIIQKAVPVLQDTLNEEGLPSPSFDEHAPTGIPEAAWDIRDALLDATMELHDLLLGPLNLLYRYGAHNNMATLQAVSRLKIASLVPDGGQISFGQLAKLTGLDTASIRRILRHAMTMRVFCEPHPEMVAHTSISKALTKPHGNDWMTTGCEEMWPAATKYVDAIQKWPGSEEPTETAFALANDTNDSIYTVIGASPIRAMRFASAMKAYTSGQEYDLSHIIKNYPWSSLGASTVVDIGGAQGHCGIELARNFKNLNVVVQDMEKVVENADTLIPTDLQGRIRFMPHNFFESQLIEANVYLFRWVFHNWADTYAIKIIQALVPTLKKGNVVLVNDTCMPKPGAIPAWQERDLRSVDINMHAIFNSYERDQEGWRSLFKKADRRFSFNGVVQPKGSALAILEFIWDAET
ncbi:hypothetical protein EAE96_003876 [Botrytis aclada]|nr:hypothetical protein EAE96_003876 [Botrytis aclada]